MRKLIVSGILLLMAVMPMVAQSQDGDHKTQRKIRRKELREQMQNHIDSVLTEKYYAVKYDTYYIGRPHQLVTLKLRANVSGAGYNSEGEFQGEQLKSDLATDHRSTFSIGASYRGISAGLSLNPGSLSGRSKDYELNVNLYNNRYGFDVVYQDSKTLAGNVTVNGVVHHLEKGQVDMEILSVNGHYVFNGSRFSYPAAFTQSYVQKKSAGSWLAGFSYLGGRMLTTDKRPVDVPRTRTYVGYFALGGGYGYNLVLGERWLFHLSLMPTVVVLNQNNITVDGERRDLKPHFPDMIFTERVAVVYQLNKRYFLAATLVMNNTLMGDDDLMVNYRKWRTRVSLGARL